MKYLMLGTPVTYTRRADVVRLAEDFDHKRPTWQFHVKGGSSHRPGLHAHGEGYVVTFVVPGVRNEPAEFAVEPVESDNKQVITWPEEGSGVVTGLVTKQIGKSVGPSGGSSLYGERDWEAGWFEMRTKVELYVVRSQLRGNDFVFVPPDAISPMVVS